MCLSLSWNLTPGPCSCCRVRDRKRVRRPGIGRHAAALKQCSCHAMLEPCFSTTISAGCKSGTVGGMPGDGGERWEEHLISDRFVCLAKHPWTLATSALSGLRMCQPTRGVLSTRDREGDRGCGSMTVFWSICSVTPSRKGPAHSELCESL